MPAKKEEEAHPEKSSEKETKTFFDAARKVLLAGIGAVAIAQDEVEEFVNRLVDRGEIAEKDGRKLVQEIFERRRSGFEKTEGELQKHVEAILDRMNIPRKSEVAELNQKIDALTKKINSLKNS